MRLNSFAFESNGADKNSLRFCNACIRWNWWFWALVSFSDFALIDSLSILGLWRLCDGDWNWCNVFCRWFNVSAENVTVGRFVLHALFERGERSAKINEDKTLKAKNILNLIHLIYHLLSFYCSLSQFYRNFESLWLYQQTSVEWCLIYGNRIACYDLQFHAILSSAVTNAAWNDQFVHPVNHPILRLFHMKKMEKTKQLVCHNNTKGEKIFTWIAIVISFYTRISADNVRILRIAFGKFLFWRQRFLLKSKGHCRSLGFQRRWTLFTFRLTLILEIKCQKTEVIIDWLHAIIGCLTGKFSVYNWYAVVPDTSINTENVSIFILNIGCKNKRKILVKIVTKCSICSSPLK